ncbi:uncharacterized protein LOC124281293 [Haliotis rubra]|uniref:uncharacterized protein LOC124281293 n=1 Tax=Haliotis rubra TaxID=36100 RepID=UPI001EE4FD58|nr:uncharacterized protein LOC124281293 [Haliotis rubra]
MTFLRACIFACMVSSVLTQTSDPCTGHVCETPGYECRLVVVSCAPDSPCPPQPECVPSGQGLVGACRYGSPVLEQTGGQTYNTPYCNDQKLCPDTTECSTEIQDIQSLCCWNPFLGPRPVTTPPVTSNPFGNFNGHCAKTFPLPAFFCDFMVPRCEQDSDCLPGSKCCSTDKCGRRGCLLARFTRECSFLDRLMGLCED